ncbi:hypothetical protein CsSME_00009024 [Camellia sinensis var. sinensis]
MCIAVFIWQDHPLYPFILLLNRDEYHNRPTKPLAWWEVEGGGGTCCCDIVGGRDGLAGGTWLASNRDGRVAFLTNVREVESIPQAKSRGHLPVRFLEAERLRHSFKDQLARYGDGEVCVKEMVEKLMRDTVKDDKSMLPHIYPVEREYQMSSIFVEEETPSGRHGTRSTSALSVKASGEVNFHETYLEKEFWKEKSVTYQIEMMK